MKPRLVVALLAASWLVVATPSSSQDLTLTDGDALFELLQNENANLLPDGTVDHVFSINVRYRIDGVHTREERLPPPMFGVPDGTNRVTTGHALESGVLLVASTTLLDSNTATIAGVQPLWTFRNTSDEEVSLSLFGYGDYDVSDTSTDEVASIVGSGNLRFTDNVTGEWIEGDGSTATAFQVTVFPELINLLDDDSITELDGSGIGLGPADLTGAFQWDIVLAPGEQQTVGGVIAINAALEDE